MIEPLRLRNCDKSNLKVEAAVGLAGCCALLLGYSELRNGQPPYTALSVFGLSTAAYIGIKWLRRRFHTEFFAILYENRIELPVSAETNWVAHWNRVDKLHWTSGGGDGNLVIFTNEIKTPLGSFPLSFDDLEPKDRLNFIQYVRHAATNVPQESWPSFCRRVAIPLIETVCRDSAQVSAPSSWQESLSTKIVELLGSRPILTYMLFPLTATLVTPMLASRRVWWTLSGLVGISALINIRIVWGDWLGPFTVVVFSMALYCFLAGIVTSRHSQHTANQPSLYYSTVFTYLGTLIVFVPLAMNALAREWIPANWVTPLKWFALALFAGPLLMLLQKRRGMTAEDRERLENDAQEIWDRFAKENAPF